VISLVHTTASPTSVLAAGLADDAIELTDRLLAVDSVLSRSKLYHGIKVLQESDAPLLVAEISEPPKAKGLTAGAVAWFRDRLHGELDDLTPPETGGA